MPRYVVYTETTIVKQAVVEVEARGIADAVEQGKKKAKAGDVVWGNAEIDLEVINVEERGEP